MSRHTDGPSTHRKRLSRALVVIALLAFIPAAAAASVEESEPVPSVESSLQFVIGGVVEQGTMDAFPGPDYAAAPAILEAVFTGLESAHVGGDSIRADWFAREEYAGGQPASLAFGEIALGDITLTMTLPRTLTDYDGDLGGGSGLKQAWVVGATDYRHGVHNQTTIGANLRVFQEDGTDLTLEAPDADIVTKGKWRESYCDCWLGGKVLRTWQKWARMTFTVDAIDGQVVAVVMPMAPNRGEAKIKLDGVNQGRFDTYAPTSENRIIMWQTPPLEAGTHTIAVINLATEGRPRIDVDAFLVTSGNVES